MLYTLSCMQTQSCKICTCKLGHFFITIMLTFKTSEENIIELCNFSFFTVSIKIAKIISTYLFSIQVKMSPYQFIELVTKSGATS